ncbi:MAG: hypothetical protein EYC71_05375 [Gammaproteobacteria bacterium]|nr:MAG: hypothetical protein EYC71_05375 [Gammaproteobacteria bacterium]
MATAHSNELKPEPRSLGKSVRKPTRLQVLACAVAGSLASFGAGAQSLLQAPTEPGADLAFALTTNGVHVVAGAPGADDRAGRVYSIECIGQSCLTPSLVQSNDLASGDLFGAAVSVFADTLVIGAPDQGSGAVYVYVFSSGSWQLQEKLNASAGVAGDRFGAAVSVLADRIAIGAPGADNGTGAAYVFENLGGNWTQTARLQAADADVDHAFGSSVALATDTLIAGAPHWASSTLGAFSQGAAYVFVRNSPAWEQQARLLSPSPANGQLFGSALAVSAERALIGAPLANAGTGNAHVFLRAGSTWTQQAQITPAGGGLPGDRFGWSVSLDADQALIGAPFALDGCGASTRYVFAAGNWTASAETLVSDHVPGGLNGWSVSLLGPRRVIGVPGFSSAASHRGAAWLRDVGDGIFADGYESSAAALCIPD